MSKLAKALTAAAGNAGGESLYVEDVFSTYLYEGTGFDGNTAQTITNGIDLDGEGGLVWIQERDDGSNSYSYVADSERGPTKYLITQVANAEGTQADAVTSFNSDGFTLGVDSIGRVNVATGSPLTGRKYASWTFRKAEKFFDVVTYTGTGTAQTIAHNLGVAPAVVIVKAIAGTNAGNEYWAVYHASLGATKFIRLNTTNAAVTANSLWNDTAPTDTHFTVNNNGAVNNTGLTYVAYLFASDAGGFGDDGSENIIKCGSFSHTNGTESVIDLGFEPQWLLVKASNATSLWSIVDTMRGWDTTTDDARLAANVANAESGSSLGQPTATGFIWPYNSNTQDLIYIAIRRPMKTPESGTEVFAIDFNAGESDPAFISGFPVDASILLKQTAGSTYMGSRLQGDEYLTTQTTAAAGSNGNWFWDYQNGWELGALTDWFSYMFKRATGFFDVVAYSGTGTNPTNFSHNLNVVPELMIFKKRSASDRWEIYSAALGNLKRIDLNTNGAATTNTSIWGGTPTATQFSLTDNPNVNQTGQTYIAYLFATLAGVSKVGSYTGTAADLNVDCGFSAGARFILIKRTDDTGDWYVWDSARGIVAGNDPYLLLNSTAAEVTSTDYIDPLSSGFTVTSSAPAALNASGGTYIFLAIA